eukprot:GHVP01002281.1.p2 GENE.GHVP01002281.1~~GHVP01002281.1.p2  ORF type:complete len:116 (+),score=14.73 GHVP01002281.1:897-1244(+)
MVNFLFSTDNNITLDEAKRQLYALYPEHTDSELIPVIQKVSCALGAKDYQQARAIMINPNRPFYFQIKKFTKYGKSNNFERIKMIEQILHQNLSLTTKRILEKDLRISHPMFREK